MSDVVVTESHALPSDEVKSRLKAFEADISKYGMKLDWQGDRADIKGTGASGDVKVTPSSVTVTVKLGMMAKMAGIKPDKLQASIEKRLKAALA
ncbi:MAG: polyhydroxyalkanoic acid system family protein [Myxococcales bacterium]|nr:polyhydroxyalkanoic acid system family protein [Myxococcales bacterium]MCB9646481.1 polyhydroxyalkanoic acid system family protein [Deltaproteobacteria bacterium]